MRPLVAAITINYNSSKASDITSESIRAILSLDYRPLEVIIVDNGSTDDSFECIKNLVETLNDERDINVRLLPLSKNYGFAVANNIAFAQRSAEAKYVALINSDLSPEPSSLGKLVKFLEENDSVAGVQGKILTWDGDTIWAAGGYLTQFGNLYPIGATLPSNSCENTAPIGFVSGAYSVYKIEPLLKCGGLFLPHFFIYNEESELGIRLWRGGYKLTYVPVIAGRHYGGITFKKHNMKPFFRYWSWKSEISLLIMYDDIWPIRLLLRIPMIIRSTLLKRNKILLRAFIDGIRMGLRLRANTKNFRLSRLREPRLRMNIVSWYCHLIRLFILYGTKAPAILYALISRSLGDEDYRSRGVVP